MRIPTRMKFGVCAPPTRMRVQSEREQKMNTNRETVSFDHRVLTGDEAKEFGRTFAMAAGRPKVGQEKGGDSPVMRGRVPRAMKDELDEAAARRGGVKDADLVREALELLLAHDREVAAQEAQRVHEHVHETA